MFLDWSLLTVVSIIAIYLFFQVLFYKNVVESEEKSISTMKATLREAEILIKKYQVQLQRSLGNIDLMTSEMMAVKSNLKSTKQSHSSLKFEKKKLEEEMRVLQDRIEALT